MKNWVRTSLAAAIVAGAVGGAAQAQQLNTALNVAQQSTQEGTATQQQIDTIDDERSNAELEYRALLQQVESQRLYVAQQQVFIQSQDNELDSLRLQIDSVGNIQRDIMPMLREMIENLENFIELDLPFQVDARMDEIADLYEIVDDPAISPAEKYRVILNAFEVEASYGRGIRTYEDVIETDEEGNATVSISYLQIGRVALIRENPDDSLQLFHRGATEWADIPSSEANNVQRAFRIAREVTTPEVFLVPLPGSEDQ
tara:strand:- start:4153 stop:4926 length:774 start_codon:yes stop_codon:yes gene_type:complete